jgi:hypothetical protein
MFQTVRGSAWGGPVDSEMLARDTAVDRAAGPLPVVFLAMLRMLYAAVGLRRRTAFRRFRRTARGVDRTAAKSTKEQLLRPFVGIS